MASIKTFKEPSSINFVAEESLKFFLKDAKRGSTFLCDGAICMLSNLSAHQAVKDLSPEMRELIANSINKFLWVINLQTGRTYTRAPDTVIEFVKITMTVDTE